MEWQDSTLTRKFGRYWNYTVTIGEYTTIGQRIEQFNLHAKHPGLAVHPGRLDGDLHAVICHQLLKGYAHLRKVFHVFLLKARVRG